MGQITQPSSPGITVLPVDRQTGPSAGAGNTGNDVLFLGQSAGNNNVGAQTIGLGANVAGGTGTGNQVPGAICIGYNAGTKLQTQRFGFNGNSDIVIGTNALTTATTHGDNVTIGNYAMTAGDINQTYTQYYQSVVVGNYCLTNVGQQRGGGCIYSVAIGWQIGGQPNSSAGNFGLSGSVVIGYEALNNFSNGTGNGASFNDSVAIGGSVLAGLSGAALDSVIIGQDSMPNAYGVGSGVSYCTAIGAAMHSPNSIDPYYATALGAGTYTNQYTVTLGAGAGVQGTSYSSWPGQRSIFIGSAAGFKGAEPADWTFLVESSDFSLVHTMMYGQMDTGNLSVGDLPYADRDFTTIGCTNALKLTNGTRGAGNPTGGGFFYVNAGALHWVGTSGTDTVVAPA